jgi:hypothetical protein
VVFPMPIDLVKPVLEAVQRSGAASSSGEPEALPAAPAVPAAPDNGALEPGEQRSLAAGAGGEDSVPASAGEPSQAQPVGSEDRQADSEGPRAGSEERRLD